MIVFIKKYYIQLITVSVLFVAIIIMIYKTIDTANMIKGESENLKQTRLDYVLAEHFLNGVYEFKQNVEYIENDMEWLDVLLPNVDDRKVQLFSSIEKLAEETGNEKVSLKVKATDPKQTKAAAKEAGAKKNVMALIDDNIKLEITLSGNYNDLIYFLQKIENLQYFAQVLSLDISKIPSTKVNPENDTEEIREDMLKTTMNVVFYLEGKK